MTSDDIIITIEEASDINLLLDTSGPKGSKGDTGQGVPVGGTTNQVLAKLSETDFDTGWVDQSGGSGGDGVWGSITGVLSDQTDLQNALNEKADVTALTSHTSDSAIHFTQSQISITESQISDFGSYYPSNNPDNFISNINWDEIGGVQSTISLSNFTDDLTPYTNAEPSVIEVGGIPSGTTFENKPVHEIFDDLFYPELFGSITGISRTFTSNVTGLREVGSLIGSITFNSAFNRGSINPQYETATPFRSGNPNQYIYTGAGLSNVSKSDLTDAQTVSNYTVALGVQNWTGRVAYDAGPQPKGSKGTNFDNPLSAGTTATITRSITGVYPYFGATVNLTTMTKQGLQTHGSIIIIDLVEEDGSTKQSIEVPEAWGNVTALAQFNTLSSQYDTINISTFTKTTITKNINGASINYDKYTHNGGTIGARRLRWTF